MVIFFSDIVASLSNTVCMCVLFLHIYICASVYCEVVILFVAPVQGHYFKRVLIVVRATQNTKINTCFCRFLKIFKILGLSFI